MRRQYRVRVVARAKQEKVLPLEADQLKVYVHAPAIEGRANQDILKLLAKHFGVARMKVQIVRGEKSRDKVIEVNVGE